MSMDGEFKRLNFFTGFFTTAQDWLDGQNYHLRKRELHSRGLHTPGVIRGEGEDLRVTATDPPSLEVKVRPGVALDLCGRTICLALSVRVKIAQADVDQPKLVYIGIRYGETPTDVVFNVAEQEFPSQGHTRTTETPEVCALEAADFEKPADDPGDQWLELARIQLSSGATQILDHDGQDPPGENVIDRRYVRWAGSVGQTLPAALQASLHVCMQHKRDAFGKLARRYPAIFSPHDVRSAALMVDALACTDNLGLGQVRSAVGFIAGLEQCVVEDMQCLYPGEARTGEFETYLGSVVALLGALCFSQNSTELLALQDAVSNAADTLSSVHLSPPVANAGIDQVVAAAGVDARVILNASASEAFDNQPIAQYEWRIVESQIADPVADAGPDRTLTTPDNEAVVTLDGSKSLAFGDRRIASYHWEVKSSVLPPVANAGPDLTVTTAGDEAAVSLDASGSQASTGSVIVRHRWNKKS
jgi:hypothetical protein